MASPASRPEPGEMLFVPEHNEHVITLWSTYPGVHAVGEDPMIIVLPVNSVALVISIPSSGVYCYVLVCGVLGFIRSDFANREWDV